MADVFTNDLRIREQESGSNAGTWGGLLNTTIRNIASAFGQGSETIPNASTHTITLADGVADEARSLYLKCTGGGQACTVTLAPNTVSKVWIISNETSYTLTFSQGSGANVAVSAGAVKVIVTDGSGSGAAVVDALSGLDASLSGLTVDTTTLVVDATNNRVGIGDSSPSNTLTITNGSSGATEANGAIVPLMIENSSSAYINFLTPNNANAGLLFSDPEGNNVGQMQYLHGSNALVFATGASEAMRISGGNVLVGKTSTSLADVGHNFSPSGFSFHTRDGGEVAYFNRKTSDGGIVNFYKDSSAVGSIGSTTSAGGGSRFAIGGNSDPGIIFAGTGVFPASGITASDGSADLGSASYRWKDLHLSGTMIGNLVKLRTIGGAMYVSPTNANTLNGNYDENTDEGDMWINYRGYQDTFNRFRDFRIGNGKGAAIVLVDGSASSVAITGSLSISSSLSKGSGSFKIDHPLPAKTETHHLVHSFVEAPQADNIYRGKVDLVGGSATVNIDTAAGMTEGTYVLLNTNTQCFTSNESGWTAVKGSVSGNTLTITAQDNTCTDTISWMVVGERHDQHMIDTDWTDDNGKVIVEPLKENN
jgi:hypothetical protein